VPVSPSLYIPPYLVLLFMLLGIAAGGLAFLAFKDKRWARAVIVAGTVLTLLYMAVDSGLQAVDPASTHATAPGPLRTEQSSAGSPVGARPSAAPRSTL
jgi:hypothetical protein